MRWVREVAPELTELQCRAFTYSNNNYRLRINTRRRIAWLRKQNSKKR